MGQMFGSTYYYNDNAKLSQVLTSQYHVIAANLKFKLFKNNVTDYCC